MIDLATWLSRAGVGFTILGYAVDFWRPTIPLPNLVAPLSALAAALAAALLSGVAVSALITLIAALLALQYLLVEVLGLSVDVVLPQ